MGKAKKIMQARETKNKDKMPSGFAETRTLAIACQTAVTPRFAVARHEPSWYWVGNNLDINLTTWRLTADGHSHLLGYELFLFCDFLETDQKYTIGYWQHSLMIVSLGQDLNQGLKNKNLAVTTTTSQISNFAQHKMIRNLKVSVCPFFVFSHEIEACDSYEALYINTLIKILSVQKNFNFSRTSWLRKMFSSHLRKKLKIW